MADLVQQPLPVLVQGSPQVHVVGGVVCPEHGSLGVNLLQKELHLLHHLVRLQQLEFSLLHQLEQGSLLLHHQCQKAKEIGLHPGDEAGGLNGVFPEPLAASQP